MSDHTTWGGSKPAPSAERVAPASGDAADDARTPDDTGAYGPDEEQLVAERLRALGYIE